MQVQNVTLSNQNYNRTSFKNVYPVYHWCKIDGVYKPATVPSLVHDCQRLLASVLNKGGALMKKNSQSEMLKFANYVASFDNDFKSISFVRSYYNNSGGYKNSAKGRSMAPMAYLVTGHDAADFEQIFGKSLKSRERDENISPDTAQDIIERARVSFSMKGPNFINERSGKLVDKETKQPMELHVIYSVPDELNRIRVIKIGFFKQGNTDNPLITNGIIDQ